MIKVILFPRHRVVIISLAVFLIAVAVAVVFFRHAVMQKSISKMQEDGALALAELRLADKTLREGKLEGADPEEQVNRMIRQLNSAISSADRYSHSKNEVMSYVETSTDVRLNSDEEIARLNYRIRAVVDRVSSDISEYDNSAGSLSKIEARSKELPNLLDVKKIRIMLCYRKMKEVGQDVFYACADLGTRDLSVLIMDPSQAGRMPKYPQQATYFVEPVGDIEYPGEADEQVGSFRGPVPTYRLLYDYLQIRDMRQELESIPYEKQKLIQARDYAITRIRIALFSESDRKKDAIERMIGRLNSVVPVDARQEVYKSLWNWYGEGLVMGNYIFNSWGPVGEDKYPSVTAYLEIDGQGTVVMVWEKGAEGNVVPKCFVSKDAPRPTDEYVTFDRDCVNLPW